MYSWQSVLRPDDGEWLRSEDGDIVMIVLVACVLLLK
jgi:hypothetical protein